MMLNDMLMNSYDRLCCATPTCMTGKVRVYTVHVYDAIMMHNGEL